MLATFVTLVIGIRFVNRDTVLILPDAYAAREAQKLDVENNAYYLMTEAIDLLPASPGELWYVDEELGETRYKPTPLSIGDILNLRRPDDDPELLNYLKNSKPAIDHLNNMEGKTSFAYDYPVTFVHYSNFEFRSNFNPGVYLAAHLAYARAQIEHWDDLDGGLQTLSGFYATLKFLQRGLVDQEYYYGVARIAWQNYFRTLQHLYRIYPDSQFRHALRTLLQSQPPPYEDFQQVLDNNFGALDDTLLYPDYALANGGHLDGSHRLQNYQYQTIANYLRENIDRFRELAELPPYEYSTFITTPIWNHVLFEEHMGRHHVTYMLYRLTATHQVNAYQIATLLSFDIEDYKSANEKYPDELHVLVPEFISELPLNPISGQPFLYTPNGTAYNLIDPRFNLYHIDGDTVSAQWAVYVDGDDFNESEE